MSAQSYQIRVCQNPDCGLRYPLMEGHLFGERCPLCLGETRLVLARSLLPEQEELPAPKEDRRLAVLLDNIRSAWNVGSILRSADGFGFSHAYLCGITPTPDQAEVRKTALGAEEFVTWSHHKDAVRLVEGLKLEGWKVWALEFAEGGQPLHVDSTGDLDDLALIVGNEVTGVDPGLLELADQIVYLPMHGQKRSFNAAVAFGAAAFAINTAEKY